MNDSTCSKCHLTKPISQFHKRAEGRKKLRSRCKDCERETGKAWGMRNRQKRTDYSRYWRAKNRDRHNWNHRACAHGFRLSYEEFVALYKKQNGCCAICKKPKPMHGKAGLCMDHEHETNQQRGLICLHCNFVIGHSLESIETLQAAIEYLSAWKGKLRAAS